MKLAMSVGNNHRYHIHEVAPRHYYQSAARVGLPASTVALALEQIGHDLPGALDRACAALPAGFPAEIRDSIAQGALKRLEVVTAAVEKA